MSAAYATQEAVWLRQLLKDLGVSPILSTPVFEGNQGCIKLATNANIKARTKHINVRRHHLRDLVDSDVINFVYCDTDNMIADAQTKPLPRPKFEQFWSAI